MPRSRARHPIECHRAHGHCFSPSPGLEGLGSPPHTPPQPQPQPQPQHSPHTPPHPRRGPPHLPHKDVFQLHEVPGEEYHTGHRQQRLERRVQGPQVVGHLPRGLLHERRQLGPVAWRAGAPEGASMSPGRSACTVEGGGLRGAARQAKGRTQQGRLAVWGRPAGGQVGWAAAPASATAPSLVLGDG
jgi:hypothetical protein